MSLGEIYKIVEKISAYSTIIPVLICILRFRVLNRSLWIFFSYLLGCILVDRLSSAFQSNQSVLNALYNFFTVFEGVAISSIYYNEFAQRNIKKIVAGTIVLFIIFSVSFLCLRKVYTYNDTIISPIEASIIIVMAGLYLFNFLADDRMKEIRRNYFYWINLAFLLYFATSLMLFLNRDFLATCSDTTNYILWGLHLVLNIVTNILSAIGIWMKQKAN